MFKFITKHINEYMRKKNEVKVAEYLKICINDDSNFNIGDNYKESNLIDETKNIILTNSKKMVVKNF